MIALAVVCALAASLGAIVFGFAKTDFTARVGLTACGVGLVGVVACVGVSVLYGGAG